MHVKLNIKNCVEILERFTPSNTACPCEEAEALMLLNQSLIEIFFGQNKKQRRKILTSKKKNYIQKLQPINCTPVDLFITVN